MTPLLCYQTVNVAVKLKPECRLKGRVVKNNDVLMTDFMSIALKSGHKRYEIEILKKP